MGGDLSLGVPLILLERSNRFPPGVIGWGDYIIHLATGNWFRDGNTRGTKPNFETLLMLLKHALVRLARHSLKASTRPCTEGRLRNTVGG